MAFPLGQHSAMLREYLISYSIVLVFGLALGFVSAIPAGAVQIQVVKSSLRGHWRTAIALAAGSGVSDSIYGMLTLFGLGEFMASARFQIYFYLLGVVVLCYLLYRSILEYWRPAPARGGSQRKGGHRRGFIAGFMLAATNPSIVLWWIVGFKVFLDLGLFQEVTVPFRIAFICAGAGGLAGYLVILALIITRHHRKIPDRVLRRMNLALIIVYAFLIAYFIYKLIRYAV
jgi:threonine/homoserine/homoserine lactone efflux protein